MEAEFRLIQPRAQECLEPLEPGRGDRGYSPKGFPESSALLTPVFLFQTSGLKNCGRIIFVVRHPVCDNLLQQPQETKYRHHRLIFKEGTDFLLF